MWKVTNIKIGALRIVIGTNPAGWPFALAVVWKRRDRPAVVLCDWERKEGQ